MSNHKKLQNTFDVIILGAGASGLMCALRTTKRGLRTAIIDHNDCAGRKIAISGGGKCNFTNITMDNSFYVCKDKDFCTPALEAFTPKDIIQYLFRHGIAYEEREHGQLFGLEPAGRIVEALVQDGKKQGGQYYFRHEILSVEKKDDIFFIYCQKENISYTFTAINVVVALGSSAWKHVGASDIGINIAQKFGHTCTPFKAALTPLTMPQSWKLLPLTGISLKASVSLDALSFTDDLLFTHSGISGPVVLQASCYWRENTSLSINFLPHNDFGALLDAKECGKLYARTLLSRQLPKRLADILLPSDIATRKIAELSRAQRTLLHTSVHNHQVTPIATGGLQKSEAALGGVYTEQVNAWSMESLVHSKLYFTGEVLDITGQLGGYNLHFAWASGYMAGNAVTCD